MAKLILKLADKVLAVSAFTKREVLRHSIPGELELVYNGIDTSHFIPSGEKQSVVLTVAYIKKENAVRKGLGIVVDVAQMVPDVTFRIVGGWYDDSINVLRSRAPDNVEFLGHVSDEALLQEYQEAKVYLQLSYYESFGMGLAEAMSCECVPVSTDRGALPEVVGDTGHKVRYGDQIQTAEAITQALQGDGRPARERIVEMFDIHKREERLVEIIHGLV